MSRNHRSAKAAGTRFETAITKALAAALGDDRVERRARGGCRDRGDVSGVRLHGQRVCIEIKDCSVMRLPEWTAEARVEAGNDSALVGVVISKRRGVGDPLKQWVHMTVADLVAVLTGEPVSQE